VSGFHLCSFIVHVHPRRQGRFLQRLAALRGAEVHALEPGGKGIVTLEAAREDELARNMEALRDMPGVVALSLIYHHHETETIDLGD